jgi:hypothetical protein
MMRLMCSIGVTAGCVLTLSACGSSVPTSPGVVVTSPPITGPPTLVSGAAYAGTWRGALVAAGRTEEVVVTLAAAVDPPPPAPPAPLSGTWVAAPAVAPYTGGQAYATAYTNPATVIFGMVTAVPCTTAASSFNPNNVLLASLVGSTSDLSGTILATCEQVVGTIHLTRQ